jgi:hypothetical protein
MLHAASEWHGSYMDLWRAVTGEIPRARFRGPIRGPDEPLEADKEPPGPVASQSVGGIRAAGEKVQKCGGAYELSSF